MQLIIAGLGNPGLKYKKTRHNVGFMVLDELREKNDFPKFRLDKKLKAEITEGMINDKKVLLAKPQTLMNSSGFAIKAIISNPLVENLIVVHDDFDLPLGEVRMSGSAGSGGHHGIQSIIDSIKTNNFKRIRVGIKPSCRDRVSTALKAEDFVLKKFAKAEKPLIGSAIKKACQILSDLASNFSSF